MTQLILNKNEAGLLKVLSKTYYMQSIQARIDDRVRQLGKGKTGWQKVLDHLNEILREAQNDVEKILDVRIASGETSDKSQAYKSIAKNAFSNAITYIFVQNKFYGNVSERIFITNKKSVIPGFEKVFTINVGKEAQEPSMDLILYSLKENSELNKCIILSLKTSLLERADQIHEWKLLMELAMSNCKVRDKYTISYHSPTIPLVCFVTIDSYNEINNPQHRGMFKFFDRAFIGKPIDSTATSFISPLSSLIDFANEQLSEVS